MASASALSGAVFYHKGTLYRDGKKIGHASYYPNRDKDPLRMGPATPAPRLPRPCRAVCNWLRRQRSHFQVRWAVMTGVAALAVAGFIGIEKLLEIGAFHLITEFGIRAVQAAE